VQAEEFLRRDLNDAQADVLRYGKVPLNDNEYGALVSLVFNIGGTAFSRSTCLRLLNKGDRDGAAGEFCRFVKGRVRGRLITLRGLRLRRDAERDLFCSATQHLSEADAAPADGAVPGLPPDLAFIPPHATLPEPTINLPRAWLSLEHVAAAAGVGTGLGAAPTVDRPSVQSLRDQAATLWQSADVSTVSRHIQQWPVSGLAGCRSSRGRSIWTRRLRRQVRSCNLTRPLPSC
jgi:lysozyme